MSKPTKFDPNGVGISNGNIFGFPVEEADADIVIIPIPWDVTASYGKGTSRGAMQVLEASTQLDFYHPLCPDAHNIKVFMFPVSKEGLTLNDQFESQTKAYIELLEKGGDIKDYPQFQQLLDEVNKAQNSIRHQLKETARTLIQSGKTPAVLGGEHSVPLGVIEAIDEQGQSFGILQLDAHADLRKAYEGFEQSHASIFYNVLNCNYMEKLVQVGIRDVAPAEVALIENSKGRIQTFFDWDIKAAKFLGNTWSQTVDDIIAELPQKVYISFDIDVLSPSLCPNTGTPVPGGFKLEEIIFLLFELVKSGREIIGFDLCEVANGEGDWDANVGARALWGLTVATEMSRRLNKIL